MKRVCILTDFRGYDPAYGLCRFVANEVKMLVRLGYTPRLVMRAGYDEKAAQAAYPGAELVSINPGKTGSNKVKIDGDSAEEIRKLEIQMLQAVGEYDVVFTHDLIFQANQWKQHVAARRIAPKLPVVKWVHIVHSASTLNVKEKVGPFKGELAGQFPNSRLWVFSEESIERYGSLYGFEIDQVVVIPPPVDFLADFHPLAREIALDNGLMQADIILALACRLDRGKQPHVLIEIAEGLRLMGYDARVLLINSYSQAGPKAQYRKELQSQAKKLDVPLVLTGAYEDARVRLPHKAVMDLFELADVLVQPSTTESYSRVLVEAAWKGCGLMLNYDLPLFRQYQGRALFGKFSSVIDVATGLPGKTDTEYSDRRAYMRSRAGQIAYIMLNDHTLAMHAKMRKERSLEGVLPAFEALIEGR